MGKANKKLSKHSDVEKNEIRTRAKGEKIEKKKKSTMLNFCDLPTEILEQITGNVAIWHWKELRGTCKRLRDVCDTALFHDFKAILHKSKQKEDKNGYEYAVLKVIHQATWPYIKVGYCPVFLREIIRQIRANCRSPAVDTIQKFILKFYKLVEEDSDDPCSQTSRLLYVITLLGIVDKCKNAVLVTSSEIRSNYWQVMYRLDGSWLGKLWSSTPTQTLSYLLDRSELLVVLIEIMIFVHMKISFRRVWEGEKNVFVFGHDANRRVRTPITLFIFDIYGPPNIFSFLKSVCQEKPKSFPKDEFNVILKIVSKEAIKWGCYQDYRLEIGPYCSEDEQYQKQK